MLHSLGFHLEHVSAHNSSCPLASIPLPSSHTCVIAWPSAVLAWSSHVRCHACPPPSPACCVYIHCQALWLFQPPIQSVQHFPLPQVSQWQVPGILNVQEGYSAAPGPLWDRDVRRTSWLSLILAILCLTFPICRAVIRGDSHLDCVGVQGGPSIRGPMPPEPPNYLHALMIND